MTIRSNLLDLNIELAAAKRRLFPKRVHLTDRRVGWVEAEIDEWIRLRMAARNV